jgi:hypothetical protein
MPSGVSPFRFVVGLAAIAGWSVGMVWLGRGPALAAVPAAVLFTLPLASLGEWLVHGVLYHRTLPGLAVIRRIHHHGHHFALFPPRRYVQSAGYEFMRVRAPLIPFRMSDNALDNAFTMGGQVALHFVAGIPLILAPGWVATRNPAFLLAALLTLGLVSWLLAYVHGAIHTPKGRWIERTWCFRWLDRHHYIHHVDLAANINFMLPLCDLLFGTQKAALSELERRSYPSYEEARLPAAPGVARGAVRE